MLGTDIWSWRRLAARKRTPIHLILFVTDRCNARCGTCFYWRSLNQGQALKPEHIDKISRSLGELVWLDISGGEPFLRQDLAWICHTFVERNGVRFINIPTNALQTSVIERLAGEILRSENRGLSLNVAVSLDGVGENHDRIRGVPGNYAKALATMAALDRIRQADRRLSLSVVTTLMRGNLEDVKQLLELGVREWKLDYHSVNLLRGNPMDASLQPPAPEQFAEVSRIQLEHCRRYFRGRYGAVGGWVATLGRVLLNRYYMKELEGRPKDISCNAGSVSCVIDANGDVYLCELLEKAGNLNQYDWDFERLWYDAAARELRSRVQRGCHCTHECFHTKNLIFAPWRFM